MTSTLIKTVVLIALALCIGSVARAAEIVPLCNPLSDPLATTRSCLVAATFPDINAQVCFDTTGKPAQCTQRADRIPVVDGTFQAEGQTYTGAPAAAAHVAVARFELNHSAIVSSRGVRVNGAANAVDRFRAPAEPIAEPPVIFAPTLVVAPPPAE